MTSYRGRFAPSPTGPLHFGSLVAALGSWLSARAAGGIWLVRIEDIDPPREREGATEDIIATLAAFGMQSDEPIMHQSARREYYEKALHELDAKGLIYPCQCSRSDLQPYGGIHPARCPSPPSAPRSPAWRLRIGDEAIRFDDGICGSQSQDLRRDVGDFVVKRADGWPAYQLAVVVDDAAQGITDIVRGMDLLDSTPRQILLQRRLGVAQPRYRHLPLVRDADGRKLSKQSAALPVDRAHPIPALRAALRFLGQADPDQTTVKGLLDAAIDRFDASCIALDRLARIDGNAAAPHDLCAADGHNSPISA